MVGIYRTEEEQVAAIKKWWQRYGNIVALLVVIVLVVTFGARYWSNQKTQKAEQASELFQTFEDAFASNDNEQMATLGNRLVNDYPQTIYSQMAALLLAEQAVSEQSDLPQAEKYLQGILAKNETNFISHIARVRLARLYIAQKNAQTALDLLNHAKPGPYGALYAEARGDAYWQLGEMDSAHQAYQQAMDALSEVELSQPLLEMKLNETRK